MKKVYGSSSGNRMQITVLACANAVGTMLPPTVNFKSERFKVKGEVPHTKYGMSPNGWIDQDLLPIGYRNCLSSVFHQPGQSSSS